MSNTPPSDKIVFIGSKGFSDKQLSKASIAELEHLLQLANENVSRYQFLSKNYNTETKKDLANKYSLKLTNYCNIIKHYLAMKDKNDHH
jgi:hypothetical protein